MTFEEEVQRGFGEVDRVAMPTSFMVTNRSFTGVIRRILSETPANEVGYETKLRILITVDTGQVGTKPIMMPSAESREIVQVDDGVYVGKYVLDDVGADIAHYYLTCTLSD